MGKYIQLLLQINFYSSMKKWGNISSCYYKLINFYASMKKGGNISNFYYKLINFYSFMKKWGNISNQFYTKKSIPQKWKVQKNLIKQGVKIDYSFGVKISSQMISRYGTIYIGINDYNINFIKNYEKLSYLSTLLTSNFSIMLNNFLNSMNK